MVFTRGSVRVGRPAPGARLRAWPFVVRSALWIWGLPFGVGFGDVMTVCRVPLGCEDLGGFFVGLFLLPC